MRSAGKTLLGIGDRAGLLTTQLSTNHIPQIAIDSTDAPVAYSRVQEVRCDRLTSDIKSATINKFPENNNKTEAVIPAPGNESRS